MPINEYNNDKQYKAKHNLPHNLEHKPIYAMPYYQFDGMFSNKTDAQYLSIGISQWDTNDISLKIMRHTGEKWTRQSEELPLHRVFDSAIFLSKVLFDKNNNNSIEIERNTFSNQPSGIEIIQENIDDKKSNTFETFTNEHNIVLKKRANKLYKILHNLKIEGKI